MTTAKNPRTTSTLNDAAPSAAPRKILTSFTREQVDSALVAAGKNKDSTDGDIRKLVNVQFHMVKYQLNTIENEAIDDETTCRLLDYFCTVR